MRKINKNSRRGIVNLLADFILTRIDKKENSIIQVTDCETFFVINGQTTSETVLDIEKIKTDFSEWFGDILKDVGIEKLNTIDVIRYGQEINNIEKGWISVNKEVFVEESEPIYELAITSEFPYGYSFNCGRLMTYYSHYIFNHMYSLIDFIISKPSWISSKSLSGANNSVTGSFSGFSININAGTYSLPVISTNKSYSSSFSCMSRSTNGTFSLFNISFNSTQKGQPFIVNSTAILSIY
jgi:hypothetical protein